MISKYKYKYITPLTEISLFAAGEKKGNFMRHTHTAERHTHAVTPIPSDHTKSNLLTIITAYNEKYTGLINGPKVSHNLVKNILQQMSLDSSMLNKQDS